MQKALQILDQYWQFKSFNDITTASVGSVESFYFDNQ